jgi:hypothetical protein
VCTGSAAAAVPAHIKMAISAARTVTAADRIILTTYITSLHLLRDVFAAPVSVYALLEVMEAVACLTIV